MNDVNELLSRRLTQVYDDKLDGLIDEKLYLEKVREYKARLYYE